MTILGLIMIGFTAFHIIQMKNRGMSSSSILTGRITNTFYHCNVVMRLGNKN